ncbi:tRNA (guanine(37)-N1)-methyltransferase-like [Centruroides sculpturatus]|uniref:tRNA (guanine(37)-N1)-methyltransferase-like n=1 Tax=Centruroides sculpturatus TaxID=218467 RepID=UPI000C6E5711|nr:tRNA (guanine(37)-N1)-methyltransferase-like [Centruroides sculpturatus]XP_023225379.1 tRNA (guanine(37)-N1)-methyltransferase-like [Centruroides sculpturatus]
MINNVILTFPKKIINFFFICNKLCIEATMNQDKKTSILLPPESVRGMKQLNRDAFRKTVDVPCLSVPKESSLKILKIVKPYILKLFNFKSLHETNCENIKFIYINPDLIKCFNDFKDIEITKLLENKIKEENLTWKKLDIGYENWRPDIILKAVLPPDLRVTSYSIIGHILHLNLKEPVLEYKNLIGEVFLDKLQNVKTVVNKTNTIDSTFRFFTMEILSGENNMNVCVKENGCIYKFDFSKVYWNPRLCTEHERIISKLESGNFLFDVFAGVGPFAIPAAKKKCEVFANDLNVHSFEWLNINVLANKVDSWIKTYNMDGRNFIHEVIKPKVKEIWKNNKLSKIHIVMNLPASAAEFLNEFIGFYSDLTDDEYGEMPFIHCYCFIKDADNYKEAAKQTIEFYLQYQLKTDVEVTFVRNVSPNKEMMRVSFKLPKEVTLQSKDDEPAQKKMCFSEKLQE